MLTALFANENIAGDVNENIIECECIENPEFYTSSTAIYYMGGGGEEALKKLILGGRGSTPYLFICHFWQKRYPLRVPSIDRCSIPFAYLPNRKSSRHF